MKRIMWLLVLLAIGLTASLYLHHTHQEGERAGKLGWPPEACPYSEGWVNYERREVWLKGWSEGAKTIVRK